MAYLYISEFPNGVSSIGTTKPGIPPQPSLADQQVGVGMTSAQSNAFNAKTNCILITADTVCSFAIGANPVATAQNMRLAAGTYLLFGVIPGQKLAVITNS